MSNQNLIVRSPDPITDAHQIIELCAKTFGPYYSFRRHLRNWYLLNSHYDWKVSAVGFADGQLVTHYGVWDYQMRIGRGVVRCGGIGCVATDDDHRGKGLMALTIPPCIEAMKRQGYDMSLLFGITNFYHKFGYTRAWSDTNWSTYLDYLPKVLPKVSFAPLKAVPSEVINQLHNRYNATVTGSAIRANFTHGYCFFHGKTEAHLWKKSNKPAGHVFTQINNNRLVCYEATGEPDEILYVLRSLANKKGLGEISFETFPYLSPIARRLRQLSCRCDRQYVKSGAAMIRIINLESCLKKIASELSTRLKSSHLCDYSGTLTIKGPESTVNLNIDKGKVVSLGGKPSAKNQIQAGHELAQLLIGTDSPDEVVDYGNMRLSGDAKLLLPILFPAQYPALHQADRY